jgi:hypothetical protein
LAEIPYGDQLVKIDLAASFRLERGCDFPVGRVERCAKMPMASHANLS